MKNNINKNNFLLDEIESITLIGERETIDIAVENTHMFFANDIYTHNSSIQEDIIQADKIAESYSKIMTADFVMSLSRKANDKLTNTARVHIIKNRFGPDGMTFPSKIDIASGQFDIYDENSASGIIAKKEMGNDTLLRNSLRDKYSSTLDD